ncbi:MAG: hypothetical protein JEY94_04680 [Melioribacteraceae bacterium]|nr:hypothetical protein [Melioribacteraceae bacterium]
MKKYQQYLPYLIIVIFLSLPGLTETTHVSLAWIEIVILIIAIILLFEFIEKSRIKRIKKWGDNRPGKIKQILKFSLLLGLPISSIIIFILHNKADLIYSIIFISVPLIILFGWIGLLDWKSCDRINLEGKYKISL